MNIEPTTLEFHHHYPAALLHRCAELLEAFEHQVQGIHAVVVSSADGMQLASRCDAALANRISAMSSSLIALGEVAARESDLGACHHVAVEAATGRILVFAIPLAPDWLVLSIVAHNTVSAGLLLWAGTELSRQLEQCFRPS